MFCLFLYPVNTVIISISLHLLFFVPLLTTRTWLIFIEKYSTITSIAAKEKSNKNRKSLHLTVLKVQFDFSGVSQLYLFGCVCLFMLSNWCLFSVCSFCFLLVCVIKSISGCKCRLGWLFFGLYFLLLFWKAHLFFFFVSFVSFFLSCCFVTFGS